ncbi:MurR/RpiR family transcriptional regulator [Vibrio sp. EA2]|uniref:MurR/RpiR family transcriptional regulator n=1 Tax=Vibrio sp. EA2 TaxID=3079860 RepID=UPI002949FF61|nr:MurR/RpiR family transcriptional regulator [Vibrio sp. EA2]MDV6252843.1 MurR/RpiR family transcriptional regulator [Vibrio sp. EA2]
MSAPTTLSELQDQIRNRYGDLSKRLQQVAAYVLDNKSSVAFETVSVIAEQADVPPSTLIRFASAFGYSGFNEMKQLFRTNLLEETSSYTDRVKLSKSMDADEEPPERPIDILQAFARANISAIQQLSTQIDEESLNKAVKLLSEADNIYVIGLGRSFSISSYLTYAFRHLNKRAFLIDGLGGMFKEQINMIRENDVVVAISFYPYAQDTTDVSDALANTGTKQIILTDSQISPLATFSDVCFVVKEGKVDAFRSQVASLCLAQTLAVSLAFQESNNNSAA